MWSPAHFFEARRQSAATRRLVREKGRLALPARVPAGGERIALVAILRDEAPYVAEWIGFHRAVGFDLFILYDNGSEDGTADIAREASEGDVTVVAWPHFVAKLNTQAAAYNHAVAAWGRQCAWMAFIDLDEFLFPVADRPLAEVLGDYAGQPSISVPWHMYGTGGHERPPEGGVVANFVRRAPFPPPEGTSDAMFRYKSISRPQHLATPHIHIPLLWDSPEHFFDEDGNRLHLSERKDPGRARARVFRLNHYYTRDAATFRRKTEKGRAERTRAKVKEQRHLRERAAALAAADIHDPIAAEKWLRLRGG